MKIIFKATFFLLILILQSCSTSLLKNNVSKRELNYFLGEVVNESQVRSKYGNPISVHRKTIEGSEYKILVYPSDSSSGNQFYCNHASYSFKENVDGESYLATIVDGIPEVLVDEYAGVAQRRCDIYASNQTNINNAWLGFAAGLNSGAQNIILPLMKTQLVRIAPIQLL